MAKRKFRRTWIALMMTLILFSMSACKPAARDQKADQSERTDFALGTVITLKVFGPGAEKAIDEGFKRIREIEDRMSVNIEDSDISKVNSNPGKDIAVHPDTFLVVEKGIHYSQLSGDAFDIAILPITKLWGIGTEELEKKGYPIPTQQQIDALLDKVDYRLVALNPEKKTIRLERSGMGLDLGGIAKGYAADEVAKVFEKMGIQRAIINMGGNVMTLGSKEDGSPWRIGIRDPRAGEGMVENHFSIVEVSNKTVVTSGDYERFFIKDGIRYHHIFDARTGQPSRGGLMSVTIVTDRSMDADALSTSVFVLGVEEGLELLKKIPGTEAVLVTEDKKVYTTPGIRKKLTITNREYKLQP